MKRGRNARDISAPKFESYPENGPGNSSPEKSLEEYLLDTGPRGQLPPLEDSRSVSLDRYCGPTPESNWVLPGRLLVGAYPASENDEETFALLSSILKCRVNKFVCLQQEYRIQGVTEAMYPKTFPSPC